MHPKNQHPHNMPPHLLCAARAPEEQQSPDLSALFSFAAGTSDEAELEVMLPVTKLEIRLQEKNEPTKITVLGCACHQDASGAACTFISLKHTGVSVLSSSSTNPPQLYSLQGSAPTLLCSHPQSSASPGCGLSTGERNRASSLLCRGLLTLQKQH